MTTSFALSPADVRLPPVNLDEMLTMRVKVRRRHMVDLHVLKASGHGAIQEHVDRALDQYFSRLKETQAHA